MKIEIMKISLWVKRGALYMNLRYFEKIIKNVENYDKKATNPFLNNQFENNPFKTIYEQTYIWITKERD